MKICTGIVIKVLCVALLLLAGREPVNGEETEAAKSDYFRRLAEISLDRGEFDNALGYAQQALASAQQSGVPDQVARSFGMVGNAYFYLFKLELALENFQTELKMMRQTGNRYGEAIALKNVGIVNNLLGKYDEALASLNEALKIFRELDTYQEIASALENIGMIYGRLGVYHLAIDGYQQAFDIAQKHQNLTLKYGAAVRMGYLYLDMDRAALALDKFQQALVIAEGLNRPADQLWALNGLSAAYQMLGQMAEAVDACLIALKLSRQMKSSSYIAHQYSTLGYIYLERDPDQSLNYFLKATSMLEKINARQKWDIYAGLAKAYRRKGQLERAVEYYEKAITELESVRGEILSNQYKATFFGKHQYIYQELVEVLMESYRQNPQAGDDIRAFAVIERAQARATLDAIAEARIDFQQGLNPELRLHKEQLDAEIARIQRDLMKATARAERASLNEQLRETEEKLDRLSVVIKQHHPHYAALHHPEPVSLAQARELLDDATALLAYFVTKDSIYAFLLTKRIFRALRLDVPSKLVAARIHNYKDLIIRDDSSWRHISRRLYIELLAPLAPYLDAGVDKLIIIPDGILHYLPFETLIQTDIEEVRSPRYLLEDYIISYAPSTTVLAELKASNGGSVRSNRFNLLVLAEPATPYLSADNTERARSRPGLQFFDEESWSIDPIPSSRIEAETITRYAGDGIKIYTGTEASEHRIKTDRLDSYTIIHFATHGLVSEKLPMRSSLVLANDSNNFEDGLLQAREIYQLRLKSALVVLSSCQTARGRILAGEGVQSLSRAFLFAGSSSVLASLWDVSDSRTAKFMGEFYRLLAEKRSKAEALRLAKLAMLTDARASSPRFWAPFILIGEATEPLPIPGESWWSRHRLWLFPGIALLLVTVTILLTRRAGQN